MNSKHWLTYYQANKQNRPEPNWASPSPLERDVQQDMGRSLSHFQLGETGEGKFLVEQAKRHAPDDSIYHDALRMFIDEEDEHARLLERLVIRFGGAKIRRHWTHTIFRLVRQALGFRFEIQVLLIAELVGAAYYRLLKARTPDAVLEETCALLLKDEKEHIDFHAGWLGEFLSRLLPVEINAWRTQFQALFSMATLVAWIDHRHALVRAGSNRREFFSEARRECIRFLHELGRNIDLALAETSATRSYLTAQCS